MGGRVYDIITVGGGLGGSSLAKAMAEHGVRVLVLEREKQFKDRVRGEWMAPWGVAEAKALGIYEILRETCGHNVLWWDIYLGLTQIEHRDFAATTPQQLPSLTFAHPEMQEVLLHAAADAGAEVRRGVSVRDVQLGAVPTVVVEQNGRVEEVQARLVVGADGRTSLVRKWAGFTVRQDLDHLCIAGMVFEDMPAPQVDTFRLVLNPSLGQSALLIPTSQGRVRGYFVCRKDTKSRLQGQGDMPRFIEECVKTGAPIEWYTGAKTQGPLATFDGADTWVEHPYQAGVVLVGDAAAASDPTWGQGLSLTLRDVRMLRDHLLSHTDWDAAGHAYAQEHDRYYGVLHTNDTWWGEIFFRGGPEAEARRAHVLPLLAQDKTRIPDHAIGGPELALNETVRRRFFGEE
jgi:2-polyprenyl-6-methoxyphenol hydroxylase-like FAD-dependent oxidoreductase